MQEFQPQIGYLRKFAKKPANRKRFHDVSVWLQTSVLEQRSHCGLVAVDEGTKYTFFGGGDCDPFYEFFITITFLR